METTPAIIRQENVELIMRNAPQSYQENQVSHDRCIEFGQNLLNAISAGMTDELDRQAAEYIERAKKTVKKMNEKRSPVTKLFDEIRTVYTGLENDIDPAKSGSIPAMLQTARNRYAASKREEAEARRREEERRIQRENALASYRNAVEADYKQSFNRLLNTKFNELCALNASITLANFPEVEDRLKNFPVILNDEWNELTPSGVMLPSLLTPDECKGIRGSVMAEILPKFREQYEFDLGGNRDNILLMLPSKKRELEAIARSNAEEAARREAELKNREAEEAARREEERHRREEEEKRQMQVKHQQQEMQELFSQSTAAATACQPKAIVKKKLVVNNPLGFLEVLNLWWVNEGCMLTVEELSKKFKSQITFCEKLANDKQDPHLIESQYISYEEEVKAK
ncbi:hypothetical protein [uncultured Bacteroides sp.]|uniref:hypothetical protein n=1 Tax=uncultured Bacteroides sp. TaxID=162156 RepID=UPI002611DB10|nr:hypothetical protein [uncultured Bacteroides sp.]